MKLDTMVLLKHTLGHNVLLNNNFEKSGKIKFTYKQDT